MTGFTRLVIIWIVVFFAQSAFAEEEISIVGGVAYSLKSEEFTVGGKPFKPEFTTIDWSLIAAYKSSYIKLNYDQSVKDDSILNNTPSGNGGLDNSVLLFSREDSGITIGYSVLDSLTLFAGYTRGRTDVLGFSDVSGRVTALPPEIRNRNIDITITEKGPFVGASYIHYLKDSGSFNFSVAYAQLDGVLSFKTADTDVETGTVTVISESSEGDSTGFSYSVTWTDQFSEDILYNITLKRTEYNFDGSPIRNESLDFDNIYNIFSIGFSKFF